MSGIVGFDPVIRDENYRDDGGSVDHVDFGGCKSVRFEPGGFRARQNPPIHPGGVIPGALLSKPSRLPWSSPAAV